MDIILPLTTLVVGTLLGLLTSLYLTYLQHKQSVSSKILEKYFEAREQLSDQLSSLADLQVTGNLDLETLPQHRKELSKLFYKYYDFLPMEVLREMLCLYACLSDKGNRLYKHQDNCLLLMEGDQDIQEFIERISEVENFRYYALKPLKSDNLNARRTASINYQARSVLGSLNHYFTIRELMSWDKYLRKSTKARLQLYSKKAPLRNLFKAYSSQEYQTTQISSPSFKAKPALLAIQNHIPVLSQVSVNGTDTLDEETTPLNILIEKRLIEITASILGLEADQIRPTDNLWDLGLHSLLALQIVMRMRMVLGVELRASALFTAAPTIQGLTTQIEQLISAQLEAGVRSKLTSHSVHES